MINFLADAASSAASMVSLICNVIFFVTIFLIVLWGFIGFVKGFWKSTWSFLFLFIGVVIIFFLSRYAATGLYNLKIPASLESEALIYEGEKAKTIGEGLKFMISNMLLNMDNSLDPSSLVIAVEEITLPLFRSILFFFLLFNLIIFGWIIDLILWFSFGKSLYKKFKIDKVKMRHRVGGTIVSMTKCYLVLIMMLSPCSALINTFIDAAKKGNEKLESVEGAPDSYNTLMAIFDSYNDSALCKTFFTIKAGENTFDVDFLDLLTQSKLSNGTSFHFYDELEIFSSLTFEMLETGLFTSSEAVNMALLLNGTFIESTFDTLAASSLANYILPLSLSLVASSSSVKEICDVSSFDFSKIDYSSTFKCLSSVYAQFKESGIIDDFVVNPSKFIEEFYFNPKYETKLCPALYELGNSSFMEAFMPSFCAALASSKKLQEDENLGGIITCLPTNKEEYEDISWGEELSILYQMCSTTEKQYNAYTGEHIYLKDMATITSSPLFKQALTGMNVDLTSYSNNPFIEGGSIIVKDKTCLLPGLKTLLVGSKEARGLLDSTIVYKVLNHALPIFFEKEAFTSKLKENVDFKGIYKNLTSSWSKNDWKEEISSMLKGFSPLLGAIEDFTNGFISGEDGTSIDKELLFGSKATFSSNVKKFALVIDESKLLSTFVPALYKGFVEDKELFFGISTKDLKFDNYSSSTSLGKELIKIVDLVFPSLATFLDVLSEEGSSLSKIFEDQTLDTMENLLNGIYESAIFNSPLEGEDDNFTKIIKGLFVPSSSSPSGLIKKYQEGTSSSFSLSDILPIEESVIDSISKWNDEGGEIESLFNVLRSFKARSSSDTQYILDSFIQEGEEDISTHLYDLGGEIERIFASVDYSILMKNALPSFIENNLQSSLESTGVKVNIANINKSQIENPWAFEGHCISTMLSSLKEIAPGGISLNNINWNSLDSSKAEILLNAIYDTSMVGGYYSSSELESCRIDGEFVPLIKDSVTTIVKSAYGLDDTTINTIDLNFDDDPSLKWKGEDGEIHLIASLLDDFNVITNIQLVDESDNFVNPDEASINVVELALLKLYNSKIFNHIDQEKVSSSDRRLSVFEYTFIYIFEEKTSLGEWILDANNPTQKGVYSNSRELVEAKIRYITAQDLDKENNYKDIVWEYVDSDSQVYGEINQFIKILKEGDLQELVSTTTLTDKNIDKIKLVNSSYILHDAIPKIMKDICENGTGEEGSININDYIINRTDEHSPSYYAYEGKNKFINETALPFDKEIDSLKNMMGYLDRVENYNVSDEKTEIDSGKGLFKNIYSSLYKSNILNEISVDIILVSIGDINYTIGGTSFSILYFAPVYNESAILQSGKVLASEKYDGIKASFFDVETRIFARPNETIEQKEWNYIVEGEAFDIFINNLQYDNQYQASNPGATSKTFEESFNNTDLYNNYGQDTLAGVIIKNINSKLSGA